MADITYSNVHNEMSSIQKNHFNSIYQTRFLKTDDVVLPVDYKKLGQCIEDMDVRDDDIWVCSFMKTGTTWCQEMAWCIANDLDFEGAKLSLFERFPFLELSTLRDFEKAILENPDIKIPKYMSNSVEFINGLKSPRFIKTHLPYKLLPKKLRDQSTKAKIIYTARNAKDTCLSYFHHLTLLGAYKEHFEEFCKLFASDSVCYSPFFDHILGYWDRRDDSQILFLKYEDMKQDLGSVIRRTAQFLGKDMLDDQILVLENHLSFESMKKNRAVNHQSFNELFCRILNLSIGEGSSIRSGTVGEGKTKMTPEFVKIFDEWEEKCLGKSGLKFL
ncbi:luciferin sulfotransferase-like [Metopolophium dirhodum]|uniref:luciferin sulfotransferase-like n=1 Tax=Metopolophium dirhodum TaxID=44670 RepID=UPI0029908008|nr:luciferin sulfotransferase-like [Metopolophium dirhodum]